jgi:hypothetical protein
MASSPAEKEGKKVIVSENTTSNLVLASWVWISKPENADATAESDAEAGRLPVRRTFDLLNPLRRWIDSIEVSNPELARSLCKRIPSQCPFERDIKMFGRTLLHIPPLCKLNPVYDEVVGLRFRALCYLVDECGEDVTPYC